MDQQELMYFSLPPFLYRQSSASKAKHMDQQELMSVRPTTSTPSGELNTSSFRAAPRLVDPASQYSSTYPRLDTLEQEGADESLKKPKHYAGAVPSTSTGRPTQTDFDKLPSLVRAESARAGPQVGAIVDLVTV